MEIQWGILGTGYIANAFANAMEAVEGARVTAVASRTKQKAEDFRKLYGIERAYGSYEELIQDEDIDVIYIATPHSEHLEHAGQALRNGKHVLCEKPMTLNQDETNELVRLAKKHDVFLMEAMWTKFLPVTNRVKDWLAKGAIGEINYMDIKFGFVAEKSPESRLYNPNLGGGALLDVGIYPIMYATHLIGRLPEQIASFVRMSDTGVDEMNTLQFVYEDGPLVSLHSSICAEIGTTAVITGTKGKIVIPDFYGASKAMLYDAKGNCMDTYEEPFRVNGYEYEIKEVTECINKGTRESKIHTLDDTKALMGVLDQVRKQWGLTYPGGK